jgi:hypothetical protein
VRSIVQRTISGWAEKLVKAISDTSLRFFDEYALLFDSTLPEYGGFYKWPINNKAFSTGIIQASGKHMKIWIGDVSIYSYAKTLAHYHEPCERVYFAHTWGRLHEARLRATFWRSTVYPLVFENMTRNIANSLHDALTSDKIILAYRLSITPITLTLLCTETCWCRHIGSADSHIQSFILSVRISAGTRRISRACGNLVTTSIRKIEAHITRISTTIIRRNISGRSKISSNCSPLCRRK